MRVSVTTEGAATIVTPEGPIINEELHDLDRQLRQLVDNWTKRIVLNLSDAALIDSAGLELLCNYQKELGEHGLRMKLCGINELVMKIMELTRLAREFEMFPDTASAVRSFL